VESLELSDDQATTKRKGIEVDMTVKLINKVVDHRPTIRKEEKKEGIVDDSQPKRRSAGKLQAV
jgi:hypothetical protein